MAEPRSSNSSTLREKNHLNSLLFWQSVAHLTTKRGNSRKIGLKLWVQSNSTQNATKTFHFASRELLTDRAEGWHLFALNLAFSTHFWTGFWAFMKLDAVIDTYHKNFGLFTRFKYSKLAKTFASTRQLDEGCLRTATTLHVWQLDGDSASRLVCFGALNKGAVTWDF